jgi:HEAT repeat protein
MNKDELRQLINLIAENANERDEHREVLWSWMQTENNQVVVRMMLDLCDDPDAFIQRRAISEILLRDNAPYQELVLKNVLTKLSSTHEDIRGIVLYRLLGQQPQDSIVVQPLLKILKSDKSANIRSLAASILGETWDQSAIPFLEWSRDHDYEEDDQGCTVSMQAVSAIHRILNRY